MAKSVVDWFRRTFGNRRAGESIPVEVERRDGRHLNGREANKMLVNSIAELARVIGMRK